MDCRAVVILLLTAQAACKPVKVPDERAVALTRTIQAIRNNTKAALVKLNVPGLLPTTSCLSLNITEFVGSEQEPLIAHSFASFACYMNEMSKLTPDLREELANASEYAQNVKLHINPREAAVTCSLPTLEGDMKTHEFVRCFLQHLDQRLSQGNF